MAWSGEAPGGDMPYLLAYSLVDGESGPEGSAAAIEALLRANGLNVGEVTDGTRRPSLPVTLLAEAGQAVLTMPHLNAQCTVPPEWLTAVRARGFAYCVFATRPWPEAVPGRPVEPRRLAVFAGAQETLNTAAHVLLPARSLRG